MEWYRDDLEEDRQQDPYPKIISSMLLAGWSALQLKRIETRAVETVAADFEKARHAADPIPAASDNQRAQKLKSWWIVP